MKAELSKDGTLTVIAESGIESYALSKWFRHDNDHSGTAGHGVLSIDTDSFEENPTP